MFTAGCCNNITITRPATVVPVLPSPDDFVKSVVKLSVDGKVIQEDKVIDEVGISASAVAINKNQLLTAAHFCQPVAIGQKNGIVIGFDAKIVFDKNMKMTYLNNNDEINVKDGVKIVFFNKKLDLCLVELESHGMVPAPIANPATIKRGDKVYVVGGPLGIFPVKTEGEISIVSLKIPEDPDEEIKINGRTLITAPVTGGNSGGPAFNVKGEVVGVVMAGFGYHHLSILTPAKMIKTFLKGIPSKK